MARCLTGVGFSRRAMNSFDISTFGGVFESFVSRIAPSESGCWEWTGGRSKKGYGAIKQRAFNGMPHQAKSHRLSYELFNGPIPEGMFVCHKCDNPGCVNPDHLFAGSAADNVHDCAAKGRRVDMLKVKSGAKLTRGDVESILSKMLAGSCDSDLANEYGMTQASIFKIRRGDGWSDVPRPSALPKTNGRKGRPHLSQRKLSADDVKCAIASHEAGETCDSISKRMGVSRRTINKVVLRGGYVEMEENNG
jgi:hypothetical protein